MNLQKQVKETQVKFSTESFSRSYVEAKLNSGDLIVDTGAFFKIVKTVNTVSPTIEKELTERSVWVVFDKGINVREEGWYAINHDTKKFSFAAYSYPTNRPKLNQVFFSSEAIKRIKEGNPVALFPGVYNNTCMQVVSLSGLPEHVARVAGVRAYSDGFVIRA